MSRKNTGAQKCVIQRVKKSATEACATSDQDWRHCREMVTGVIQRHEDP